MEAKKRNLSWGAAALAAAGIALALYSSVPATQTQAQAQEDPAPAPAIAVLGHRDPSLAGLRVSPDAAPSPHYDTF